MPNSFKQLIIVTLSALLGLTACGGSSTPESSTPGKVVYQTTDFALQIPQDWEIIQADQFPTTVPSEIVSVFQNNIKNEIFTANATVAKFRLTTDTTSEDFAKSSQLKIQNELLSYQLLESQKSEVPLSNRVLPAFTYSFQGKQNPSDPLVQFKQLTVVNNKEAYTLTTSSLPSEDESVVILMDEMLDSFTLK